LADDNRTELHQFLASDEFQEHKSDVPDLPIETLLEVLSILPIGVALYTPDQRMWAWNRIAADVSNLPAEVTYPGIPLLDILRAHARRGDYGEGDVEELVAARLKAVYDNKVPNRELGLPNGHVGEYGTRVLSDNTMVAFVRDITEQRNQEAEILARQARLEDLNKQKDELFAIIAHDLRSPLTAVVGFAEMIETLSEADFDPDKMKTYARNVATGAKGLAELVENLLNWARLQMDDLKFKPEEFSLSDAALTAIQPLMTVAREKGVILSLNLPALTVFADLNMTQTVLRNLINNGIKFTARGGTVTIGCQETTDGQIKVHISDDGVGMPGDVIRKLLDGVVSHSTPGTSNEIGTGLGLRICHKFISLHDSKLTIESTPGKGSTFSFHLDKA
jgi:signal transduction histidine kinase